MGISDTRSAVAATAMLLSGLPAQGATAAKRRPILLGYATLVKLFEQWRDFEHPTLAAAMCPTTGRPPWRPRPRRCRRGAEA